MSGVRTYITTALIALSASSFAQFKGDDDGILMQKAASRDSIAIAEAVSGWWTNSMKEHDERIAWWRDAKFGCFIHWGVYSVPGGEWKGKKVGGYAEHLMRKEKIPRQEYADKLIKTFNPTEFNADAWVKLIKNAGMRYLIITAKHHDGVAMYPSAIGDYTLKQSAFKRDPMQELSAACKKYGIKFGFYYSHAFDWEDPNAPGNDWDYNNPGGDKNLFGGTNWYDQHPELLPKAVKYVNEKSIPQIQELLRKYHPDIIWFDTPHKLPLSENIRILKAIRDIDNKVVVNGRLARSSVVSFGDYKNTADRPAEFYPVTGDWEAIPTTNESYGYSKFDDSHKPAGFFIQLMAKATAKGGNLLMNIGPMGNGIIDPRDTTILHKVGAWLVPNGESIYGAQGGFDVPQPWGVVTQKGDKKYLHVFKWPKDGKLLVNGFFKINSARLLVNNKSLVVKKVSPFNWEISVPEQAPDANNTVLVLETTKGPAPESKAEALFTKDYPNVLLAFDATQQGKGFGFGDGKTNRYYVQNWTRNDQSLKWLTRNDEPVTYAVKLKYEAEGGGSYTVSFGDKKLSAQVLSGLQEQEIGSITLPKGEHTLEIKSEKIAGKELMKLMEVTLTPVK
ncbi:alpha-L-fucosidase [Chitinophaga sp. SYP-B3965]|uniref:alpha-L-fucosidase n=1 Tax=Chitinophaga sp. SYP-B3965 TaxID=2663120 RepID=UPI0012995B46|nr:alpha-L-fucosidase [Chitinophaga sp. SYP-B3965]MRG47468.1 alpha-L-fucosidase [Chitinophaga sp. SYP-B3965]